MNRITMKDIPADDRPYEKCLRTGPEGLSDGELLSIIIRTGSREDSSLALAQKILALNYPSEGAAPLYRRAVEADLEEGRAGRRG